MLQITGSAGRFSGSAIKCRRCRRRSVPARSGAAQFALRDRRRPATSQQRSGGLYFLALNQYFIRDKTILAGQNADFGGFLRSKAGSAGRFLVRCPFIGILISCAARVPSKGSLSLFLPSRAGPLLTGPRTAMPFDRHTCHGLFAPLISDANKWCK